MVGRAARRSFSPGRVYPRTYTETFPRRRHGHPTPDRRPRVGETVVFYDKEALLVAVYPGSLIEAPPVNQEG